MANVFRKSFKKDNRGIMRPTRKQIPIPGKKGISRAGINQNRLETLKNKGKPISALSTIQPSEVVKICIQRKLGGIGDVIMTTPLAEAFKARYPNCEFTYATQPGSLFEVLQNNPFIDHIVDFATIDPNDYHLFADVTTTGLSYEKATNPPRNRIDLFADYVGIRLTNYVPTYVRSDKEQLWAKQIFEKWFGARSTQKVVFLDISSVDVRRTWPVEKSVRLISELNNLRNDIRFLINDFNSKLGRAWTYKNCVDISQYGLREKAALIGEADIFVGPDSGMLHIAGALDKDIVSVFGSTPSAARINHYPRAIGIESDIECFGCWYKSCGINYKCMQLIESSTVRDAILAKLAINQLDESLLSRGVDIYTSSLNDYESQLVAEHLRANLMAIGFTSRINPSGSLPSSIAIDIVKTSCLTDMRVSLPAQAALRVGYLLVEENDPAKEALAKIMKGYDLLVTTSKDIVTLLSAKGITRPIYSVGLPVFTQIPTVQPSADKIVLGSILRASERSNIDILVESFKELSSTNPNLELRLLIYGEDSSLEIPTIDRLVIQRTIAFHQKQHNEFWEGLNIYVNPSSTSIGFLVSEAIQRGIPVASVTSNTMKSFSKGLYYEVPTMGTRYYQYEEAGRRLGTGPILTRDSLISSLQDTIDTYNDQVALVPQNRDYISSTSGISQTRTLINFVHQKLMNK